MRPRATALLCGMAVALSLGGCAQDRRTTPGADVQTSVPPTRDACAARPLDGPFLKAIPGGGSHDALLLDRAVLHGVNRIRCSRGIAPLGPDRSLTQAAQMHTADMTRLGLFQHDMPVPGRETVGARLDTLGARYRRAAENIAENFYLAYQPGRAYREIDPVRCAFTYADGTPIERHSYASLAEAIVTQWMDSTGHRQNILNQGMTRHGFAIAPVGDKVLCGRLYATQVFAG